MDYLHEIDLRDDLHAEVISEGRYGQGTPQRVLRIKLRGRVAILKLFGHRRSLLRTAIRNLSHLLLVAKTSAKPAARLQTERRLLELWRKHGFRVPDSLDLELPIEPRQPWLVLEYVEGPLARTSLHDPKLDLASLVPKLDEFWSECGRRHELALRLREPGLIHTHPGFRHLIDREGGFTFIDFEDAFTNPRDIDRYACIELSRFLLDLESTANPELIETAHRSYPDRGRLARARAEARVGRGVPIWLTPLVRNLSWTRKPDRLPSGRLSAPGD